MIDKIITYTFKPINHPIAGLSVMHRKLYLCGIGELLHSIGPTNAMARFCFDCLCEVIINEELPEAWADTDEMKNSKAALKLCRTGWRFFRMSDCFWWDVYRIAHVAQLPILSPSSEKNIHKCLNLFTKKYYVIAKTYFYGSGNGKGLSHLLLETSNADIRFHAQKAKRLIIVGTMSAGKSTLINALVGRKVSKMKATVCTSHISYYYNKPIEDGVVYSDGSSFIQTEKVDATFSEETHVGLHFTGNIGQSPLILIDTPGVDYAYADSHKKDTELALKQGNYDAIICVVNAPYAERTGENELLNKVLAVKGKKKLIIFNQLDKFCPDDDSIDLSLKQFKRIVKSKGSDAKVIPLSARFAYLLKREMNEELSQFEAQELTVFKEKTSSLFYDFGLYGTDVRSKEKDFFAISGLNNLETNIINL